MIAKKRVDHSQESSSWCWSARRFRVRAQRDDGAHGEVQLRSVTSAALNLVTAGSGGEGPRGRAVVDRPDVRECRDDA